MATHKIYYLSLFETERLNWKDGSFYFPDMERMGIYADGSCFFHAILASHYKPYIEGKNENVAVDRIKMVSEFRMELSSKLSDKIYPRDPSSLTYYQKISRGQLEDFSKEVPQYSIDNMKKELSSTSSVDNVYNEFISDVLNKDIYILDLLTEDVYVTGGDLDILYKGRPSIVLLYIPGHYELVGLRDRDNNLNTLFGADHPFIQNIIERLKQKVER